MAHEDVAEAHSHDVARLRQLAQIISPLEISTAFVASLGTRKLEYRSALGSYAFARVLPEHSLDVEPNTYATICATCGWARMPQGEEEPESILLGERRRWGGVRHLDPRYALLDLDAFKTLPALEPTPEDWKHLRLILRTPALLAPAARPADLERALKAALPSNRNERGILIRILAYAGILQPRDYPTFFDGYVPPSRRVLPPQRFAEWGYPTIWWRASDGIRSDAVHFWFPTVPNERAV